MASRFLTPFTRGGTDPLVGIYREMNRMFDDVFSGALGPPSASRGGAPMTMPSLEVHEEGNQLNVAVELPGVKANEVDVRLDGDVLTISGEKKSDNEQKQGNYHVMERSYGRFSRSLQLPFRPDPNEVRATFENGVLQVRLQRNPQQEGSRRIEVQTAESSGARIGSAQGSSSNEGGRATQATGGGGQQPGEATMSSAAGSSGSIDDTMGDGSTSGARGDGASAQDGAARSAGSGGSAPSTPPNA